MWRGPLGEGRGRARSLAAAIAGLALLAGLAIAPAPASAARAEAAASCPTSPWKELEVAHEIIDVGTVATDPEIPLATYKDGGENPIPHDVWDAGYEPPSPYIANTTRNLQFNESQFIASPGEPICETRYITTSDGYTWGAMSTALSALWPYDSSDYKGPASRSTYYAGALVETPPPGVVKATANFKAQNMMFWANEDGVPPGTPGAKPLPRYFVKDRWGNGYVMHASGKDTPEGVAQAFENAVLPPGWTKKKRNLNKDLILKPARGSDGPDGSFHYLVIRDSADNTYHQFKWSRRGSLQAKVDGSAMPIWGGQDRDVLAGGREADLIHGAGDRDKLRPRGGNDEVWGDAGRDTVVLRGRSRRYKLLRLNRKRHRLVIAGFGSRKQINYVERLRFSETGVIKTRKLRHRDVGERLR